MARKRSKRATPTPVLLDAGTLVLRMRRWVSSVEEASRLSSYEVTGPNPFSTLGGRMVLTARSGDVVMVRPRRMDKTGPTGALHNLLQPVSGALEEVLRAALRERRIEVTAQLVSHPRDLARDCRLVAEAMESVGLRVTNRRLG